MMIIGLLLTSLFSQDTFLVKQGEVEVPLSDLDAYVYLLHESTRGGFADQHDQIEKNIYTILNVNIVYHYINQSELKNLDVFQEVIESINQETLSTDQAFIDKLDLDEQEMLNNVRQYKTKIEFYRTMLQHLNNTVDEQAVLTLAKEQYMVNKAQYEVPEIRDLSVIVLPADQSELAQQLLSEVKDQDIDGFHQQAAKHSVDPSTQINQGNWGEFKKMHFNYAFADDVYSSPEGVVPQLLEDKDYVYIVRVNDIQAGYTQAFEDVKEQLIKKVKGNTVVRQFQNIINTQAVNQLEVNPELVAHVFDRYKVFAD